MNLRNLLFSWRARESEGLAGDRGESDYEKHYPARQSTYPRAAMGASQEAVFHKYAPGRRRLRTPLRLTRGPGRGTRDHARDRTAGSTALASFLSHSCHMSCDRYQECYALRLEWWQPSCDGQQDETTHCTHTETASVLGLIGGPESTVRAWL